MTGVKRRLWQSSRMRNQCTESLACLYTDNERSERQIKETTPFTTATERVRHLQTNLSKEAKTCTRKTVWYWCKKSKTTQANGERYTVFVDWKNQHCGSQDTTESNLQIQCNPSHITNRNIHRIRTKNCIICMEIQKISNSQSNLDKEKWSWRNQALWLQTILHKYSNQDSMALIQKQKYRSMEQERKSRDKLRHPCSPNLSQKRQGYTMKKR